MLVLDVYFNFRSGFLLKTVVNKDRLKTNRITNQINHFMAI